MTIDERLDRLTARHEALTQSIELLLETSKAHERYLSEHEKYRTQVMEGSARLVHVGEIHERRIYRLEEGGDR